MIYDQLAETLGEPTTPAAPVPTATRYTAPTQAAATCPGCVEVLARIDALTKALEARNAEPR